MNLSHKLCLLLSLVVILFATTACEEEEKTHANNKTLFMYMPWSTDLTSYFYNNIADMEKAIVQQGGLKDERVVVFLATSATEASMFELVYSKGSCERRTLKEYDSPRCTTEEGLTGIFTDMAGFAPAPVYAMTIGCHGLGWLPVNSTRARAISDFKPHWEYIGVPLTRYFGGTTAAYQTDISTLADALTNAGIKMEYILFDDCYMSSIEVAYELRNVADYLIACPTEIMAYGMPYATIGKYLLGTPDYQAISEEFYRFYSTYESPYGTLGITDCRELDALAAMMKELNSQYTFDTSQTRNLQVMDGYSPTIFYDFMDYVRVLCNDDAEVLEPFEEQLDKAVPYKVHTERFFSGVNGRNQYIAIHTYSGITTSAPSRHARAADWVDTSWYKATH